MTSYPECMGIAQNNKNAWISNVKIGHAPETVENQGPKVITIPPAFLEVHTVVMEFSSKHMPQTEEFCMEHFFNVLNECEIGWGIIQSEATRTEFEYINGQPSELVNFVSSFAMHDPLHKGCQNRKKRKEAKKKDSNQNGLNFIKGMDCEYPGCRLDGYLMDENGTVYDTIANEFIFPESVPDINGEVGPLYTFFDLDFGLENTIFRFKATQLLVSTIYDTSACSPEWTLVRYRETVILVSTRILTAGLAHYFAREHTNWQHVNVLNIEVKSSQEARKNIEINNILFPVSRIMIVILGFQRIADGQAMKVPLEIQITADGTAHCNMKTNIECYI